MYVINTERIPIKVWASTIDDASIQQAKNLANLPITVGHIALMPDAHSGYGMPIGGVVAIKDAISPGMVGVDIGCGMMAMSTDLAIPDDTILKKVLQHVRTNVPVGFEVNKTPADIAKLMQHYPDFHNPATQRAMDHIIKDAAVAVKSLGGSNHFIEFQKDPDNNLWVMIHTGSRGIGKKTCDYFTELAKDLCDRWHTPLTDRDLAFLPMDDPNGKDYYNMMQFCLQFAKLNRTMIMDEITNGILNNYADSFTQSRINIHHNYAAYENHSGKNVLIHRKGATCIREGILGIIPGSMGTESYIVSGLNKHNEAFQSCSHGAGRKMSRAAARRQLNIEDEKAKMSGILHGLRHITDLDEAPGAYKDITQVMKDQEDLVQIEVTLTPIASVKG